MLSDANLPGPGTGHVTFGASLRQGRGSSDRRTYAGFTIKRRELGLRGCRKQTRKGEGETGSDHINRPKSSTGSVQ
jgi:hypothetical protein